MIPSVARARLAIALFALLFAAWAGALASLAVTAWRTTGGMWLLGVYAVVGLAAWQYHALLLSRLPAMARTAQWYAPPVVGLVQLAGDGGVIAGVLYPIGLIPALAVLLVTTALMWVVSAWCARGGDALVPESPQPFFWRTRGHIADYETRKYSLIAMAFVGVMVAGLMQVLPRYADDDLSNVVWTFGGAHVLGVGLALIQYHWCRALGFVPWALLLLAVAFAGLSSQPDAAWPLAVLGFAGGLAHSPLVTAILSSVPARQRWAAILIQQAGGGAVAGALILFLSTLHQPGTGYSVLAALAALATAVTAWPLLWRPFVETINELFFRPMWWPKGYGPGVHGMPTRGPLLIVGNHAAWFDPVWVAGVVPIHTRALMNSAFLDKPFLKWLCGSVYRAIRVPDERIRRVTPEIDEAVAALEQGEAVMLFPEAWLRRKEEQPLRRFANGVHRILSRAPETPVIACWIEDGWGSFSSYKGGPPAKGKPWDKLKRIRVGVSAPEVLPAELLADDVATRRYLMEAVLNARNHVGLPAYPMPPFGADDKAESAPPPV